MDAATTILNLPALCRLHVLRRTLAGMMAVAMIMAAVTPVQALSAGDCQQHDQEQLEVHAASHGAHLMPDGPAVRSGGHDQACDHCPETECGTHVTCVDSTGAALLSENARSDGHNDRLQPLTASGVPLALLLSSSDPPPRTG